jgi:signal transduction histidine kinase
MLISGIQLSKGVERNQSFYLMSTANLMGSLGAGLVVVAYLFFGNNLDPYRFFEELPTSLFKIFLFLGYVIFGLSMISQPLYFRALRKRVSTKFILASLGYVILFFLAFLKLGEGGNYLNRSFAVHIFIISLLSFLIFEITASDKHFPTIWLKLIRSGCSIFIGIFLVWMVIVVVANRQGHIFGFTLTDIAQFDFSFRFIRGSLFVFLQLLILMHWMEHFSENAIKVKIRDEKIQNLLLEKDILIENLSNKNALVETGALSAGLAHEFNQFLARIELNSDEVVDKINRPNVNLEEVKSSMSNILKANHSAAKLIISLRKLFQSGKDVAASINLDKLVEEVASLYADRARKSKILIELDLQAQEPIIAWDSLIRQLTANLISNAIEALDSLNIERKIIHIKSRYDEKGWYQFCITDNGLGIRPEQAGKLFNLFASSKSSGTGIGLWLSHYIAERHQGSLTFENLPNHGGVTFFLSIPPGKKSVEGGGNGSVMAI